MFKPNSLIAEVSLSAFAHNCRLIRSMVPQDTWLCAAVKADAYGHGVHLLMPVLKSCANMLAVVTIAEARELRLLDWTGPVLLMGAELNIYDAQQKAEHADWLVTNDISVTISSLEDLQALGTAARRCGKIARVHVMFDSGMTREGVYESFAKELVEHARIEPRMQLEGLYTHFASADEADKAFTQNQIRRFSDFVASVQKPGLEIPLIHAGNSAGTIDLPACHFTMVRPGISIYGCHASDDMITRPDLRPVMRVKGYITLVKDIPAGSVVGYGGTYRAERSMTIAIVPMGYADGYDRRLANCGKVLIAGEVANVIGRVSMDQVIIDVTALAAKGMRPVPGDEAILIDNRSGSPNSAEAIARQIGTISYEVLTQLGRRVVRVAVDTDFLK